MRVVMQPVLLERWRSQRDERRARRAFACGALLSSLLFSGFASNASAQTRVRPALTSASPGRAKPASYAVFGKRYHVLASSDDYRESGIASWYGGDFDGRPTASGETYDMDAMTAAHKTLPIPSWVEVTNLSNGKRVTVKINDRGPFVGKRLIDLSRAAARALDIVPAGTARVEVRALAGPPQQQATVRRRVERIETPTKITREPAVVQPAATTTLRHDYSPPHGSIAASRPAQSERLFAQVGKFTSREDAVQLVDRLKAHGFVNAFVVTEDRRRRSLHRIRVGPLFDATEVDRVSDRLRELGARRSREVTMP